MNKEVHICVCGFFSFFFYFSFFFGGGRGYFAGIKENAQIQAE